jgi:sugar lactone lactonase YvrE
MLAVWSDDTQLTGGTFPKINGIAFDGRRTLYTTNYSTGELFAIRIALDGSARPARPIVLDTPMTNPDGIRWREGYLYVADNASGLTRVDPRRATRTVIDDSLDQPTSLVFTGRDVWITEGQVLRLQAGQPPNLPFKVVRRCAWA